MTASVPYLFVPVFSWPAAPGGKLHTYAAGGTTPATTYAADGSTPNANPVVLDATGSAVVRLTAGVAYHFVLKDSTDTTTIWDADTYQSLYLTNSSTVSYPQTAAELAAGATPTNLSIAPGDPRRFGAVLDGTTDDTAALTRWASVGGALTFPALTAKISSTIFLVSNTTISAAKGAKLTTSTVDISFFTASGASNILVSGMRFTQVTAGTAAHTACFKITTCTDCRFTNCYCEGMQFAGVQMDGCARCKVDNCYFTAFQGTVQDASDVVIYNASSYCQILNNWLNGGRANGVLIQDPLTGLVPHHCLVQGNYVGTHQQFGIANYIGGPGGVGDCFNKYLDNWVDGITGGAPTFGGGDGTGIYVVGAWSGGVVIQGNHVNNCCSATLDRSHAPAGIGLTSLGAGTTRPVITGNTVTGMTQGDGILVVLCPSGALVEANEITLPASNNGTGTGGATLVGACIRIETASFVTLGPNQCVNLGTGNAVFIFTITSATNDNSMSGGYYECAQGATVRIDQSGGLLASNITLSGVRAKQTGNTSNALLFAAIANGTLVGCNVTAGTQPALAITACTRLQVSGGNYSNTANPVISTSGTCTGSFIDQSVNWGSVATGMGNGATGLNVTWRANAAPATGTWAVGDTTEQNVPVVGQPKRWRTTVAGTPGTQVSEGIL